MLGHSHERDGLSPIPTVHRDGLGNAPRPPVCLGLELELHHCSGLNPPAQPGRAGQYFRIYVSVRTPKSGIDLARGVFIIGRPESVHKLRYRSREA